MNSGDLKKLVKATIKRLGPDAPAHFGVKQGTLDRYMKTGQYPLSLIEKILFEQGQDAPPEEGPMLADPMAADPTEPVPPMPPEPMPPEPMPRPRPQPRPAPQPAPRPQPHPPNAAQTAFGSTIWDGAVTNQRVEEVIRYIQGTIDVYLRNFATRIDLLEKHVAFLRANQMRAAVGSGSLTRPGENAPVEQVFTTNPNPNAAGQFYGMGNALDTGIAPTREQVEAQANMTILEGVPIPGGELARPATFIPNTPAFGFGWNVPRPRK